MGNTALVARDLETTKAMRLGAELSRYQKASPAYWRLWRAGCDRRPEIPSINRLIQHGAIEVVDRKAYPQEWVLTEAWRDTDQAKLRVKRKPKKGNV